MDHKIWSEVPRKQLLDLEAKSRYGPYDQVQWQFELNLSQKFNILFHVWSLLNRFSRYRKTQKSFLKKIDGIKN